MNLLDEMQAQGKVPSRKASSDSDSCDFQSVVIGIQRFKLIISIPGSPGTAEDGEAGGAELFCLRIHFLHAGYAEGEVDDAEVLGAHPVIGVFWNSWFAHNFQSGAGFKAEEVAFKLLVMVGVLLIGQAAEVLRIKVF